MFLGESHMEYQDSKEGWIRVSHHGKECASYLMIVKFTGRMVPEAVLLIKSITSV